MSEYQASGVFDRGFNGNRGDQNAREYLGSVNTKGTKVRKENNNNKSKIIKKLTVRKSMIFLNVKAKTKL